MKQKRKTWQHLLAIPVMLLIDVVAMVLAAIADVNVADTSTLGHPAPFITLLAVFVLGAITVLVVVIAVIRTIAGIAANAKDSRE